MEQRRLGGLVLLLTAAAWLYYSAWVLITPFIEREQPVRLIFPPRDWALAAPVLAGVGLFGTTLLTLGCFLVSGELRKMRAQQMAALAHKKS
ncbi:hypothetical protein COHA_008172 [Chlorella ohadii]|uniref:Dolichol phosphate-mannose biosynthesis regulatory protein n=1 Tax=Chlorella ohadii TaxID=2649997 RepID=A0AAD5DLT0_9CHLO|nr:hypothetical protein COHA_008172 [Chlorella ohadii]